MWRLKRYIFGPRFRFSRFHFKLIAIVLITIGIVMDSYIALFKILPKITIVNRITNPTFSRDANSWSLVAVSGSTTPAGWVIVPGNSTYSTSDFLVMKYEAKCAATSDLTTGLTSPNTGYYTYYDNRIPCTAVNNKAVVSVASGYPIAIISQTKSIARCNNIKVAGGRAHLITNKEWMTIARNAEAQASNWSLGSVGSGYLFAGHNDNAPAHALIASSKDTDNYRCAYTNTSGENEAPSPCPSNTASGASAAPGNQVRVLTLSNGSAIWDLAGNVWEWNSDTITESNEPGVSGESGFNWREFTALTSYGNLSYDLVRPSGSTYNSKNGVGMILHNSGSSSSSLYGLRRGGKWKGVETAGAFTLGLYGLPREQLHGGGFRCASQPIAISQSFSSYSGRTGGGNTITVGSYTYAKVIQSVNVGDTSTYDFSTYVYDSTSGNVGGTVSSSITQLYYNGATVTTTYADAGSGWWKLSGTLTGINALREFGLLVKAGKTIKTDDFNLSRTGT